MYFSPIFRTDLGQHGAELVAGSRGVQLARGEEGVRESCICRGCMIKKSGVTLDDISILDTKLLKVSKEHLRDQVKKVSGD